MPAKESSRCMSRPPGNTRPGTAQAFNAAGAANTFIATPHPRPAHDLHAAAAPPAPTPAGGAARAEGVAAAEVGGGDGGVGGAGGLEGPEGAGAAEVGMRVVDARVDDADADPLAGLPQRLPHLRGADQRHRRAVGGLLGG